jgi:hypothetical protein
MVAATHLKIACLLTLLALIHYFSCDRAFGETVEIFQGDSFQSAAENLKPGDTLIIHEGTYSDSGRISISVKGTSTSPVTIKSAENEARPVITRAAWAPMQNTINIEGARYLTIKGLEITGNGGDGINLNSNPAYITIEDLVIHEVDVGVNFRSSMHDITVKRNHIYHTGIDGGTGEGMYVGCNWAECIVSDSVIENNWIHDNLPGTSQGDGIEVKVGSHSNVIRDNVIYNMSYPGIFVYGTQANPPNIVEGNVIWNCLEGIYAVADASVRNNIILQSGTGLSLYSHEQVSQFKNVSAVHNTIYDCDDGVYVRWGGQQMILANNAIYCRGKTAINGESGISGTVRSNYIEGAIIGDSIDNFRFFYGGSSSETFQNAPDKDFRPKNGSVLVGNAISDFAPLKDFNGARRTPPHDVGVYEKEGLAANPGWNISPGFKGTAGYDNTPPSPPKNLRIID